MIQKVINAWARQPRQVTARIRSIPQRAYGIHGEVITEPLRAGRYETRLVYQGHPMTKGTTK